MIPGEYKIRIGKDLQTGKFSVSLPAWQKKGELHRRNKHNGQYDFPLLMGNYPPLKRFVSLNPLGTQTINFFNPQAVKALNKALLVTYYGIRYWDIPKQYLCPPIPGRADYIHYIADLIQPDGTTCLLYTSPSPRD